jgi:23S rRNA pseudouridine1911/1915/1917 synthase
MNVTINNTEAGQRLDVFLLNLSLADQLSNPDSNQEVELNRSQIKKLIESGSVLVDGAKVKAGFKLKGGETIELELPDSNDVQNFELPIIYEDDNVIVFNKPAGMLTHAKGGFISEQTVASAAQPKTIKLNEERTGIVHRLDRDTSGVIIAAKNPEAKSLLMRQFSDRKAKKTYLAIIEGQPKLASAKLDWPIARNPKTPSLFRVEVSGKPAQTNYQILDSNQDLSLVELRPITGRTHQLRVHMLNLGHPIVGDRFYNQDTKLKSPRLMLHAARLEITIPGGMRKIFEADLPADFYNFMNSNSLKLNNTDVAQ